MGISTTTNVVNIFQTVLSTQFLSVTFIVIDPDTKVYNLGTFTEITSDVVLLNGLYQIKGINNSYILVGTNVIFDSETILTIGDEIVVYFDGQI